MRMISLPGICCGSGGLNLWDWGAEVIHRLGLEPRTPIPIALATGARERLNTWRGQVIWHDRPGTIRILESPGTALLSMRLPEDSQLTIRFRGGGDALIEELARAEPN